MNNILFFIFAFLLLISAQTTDKDILSVVKIGSNFTIVSSVLQLTGDFLGNTTEPLSAFVPYDSAVRSSGLESRISSLVSVPGLARKMLSYGIVPLSSDNLFNNGTFNESLPLNGTGSDAAQVFQSSSTFDNSSGPVYFTLRNGQTFLNNFVMYSLDNSIEADNGVVFPVQKVPLPDFTFIDFCRLFNDSYAENALNLTGFLQDSSNSTVFTPSNAAFERYARENNISIDAITGENQSSSQNLLDLINYHVVQGTWSFLNLTNNQLLSTKKNGSFIRINIYGNNTFTANGNVIPTGGWIKPSSSGIDNGTFSDSLAPFTSRTGFFYPMNDVLPFPTANAYQEIGRLSNFRGLQLDEDTIQQLLVDGITVFYHPGLSSVSILNGTRFLPGLYNGDYNAQNGTVNVLNDGQNYIINGTSQIIKSVLVTNGVIYVLEDSSSSTESSVASSSDTLSSQVTETSSESDSSVITQTNPQ